LIIKFLGTGTSQGLPVINCNCSTCLSNDPHDNRLRCSIYINWDDLHIVVDTGPDFRQQILKNLIRDLNFIFYTHEHYDHTAGIDDIRPYYFKNQKPLDIFLNQRVFEEFQNRFGYIFKSVDYHGLPKVNSTIVDQQKEIILSQDHKVIPIEINHGALSILGYRFANFAYLTDVSEIPNKGLEKLQNLDVLVISALQKEKHHSHLNLDQALEYIEIIKPQKAYLVHMSHKLGPVANWRDSLPKNVFPAFDGLTLHLT
jgi:phosphoribosyl 1,2-cyclic phosphate phosphodiesterase